jgi:hypothetical protein
MRKFIVLFIAAILFVSCNSIRSKSDGQNEANISFITCQFDNNGEYFEISIPTPIRNHNSHEYPYHYDGLELQNEYLFLFNKDTCRLTLNYYTGQLGTIDSSEVYLKQIIQKSFYINPPKGKIKDYYITKTSGIFEVEHDEKNSNEIIGYQRRFGLIGIEIENCKDTITTQKIINSMRFVKGKVMINF